MNSHLLITTIVQQTMVFIAQLATAGGVRAPLAKVADDVFLGLTRELMAQGLKKKVIADMFGMGLRTYHRRVQSLEQSKSFDGKTVWEAVLSFVQEKEPVTTASVLRRFANDDPEIVSGVLNDLVQSGLAYRSGRAQNAVYRFANEADFLDAEGQLLANRYVVWLTVYRQGPLTAEQVSERANVSGDGVARALSELVAEGKVSQKGGRYESDRFEVPCGQAKGWEAAVLDHYQALVSAKLRVGAQARDRTASARGRAARTLRHPQTITVPISIPPASRARRPIHRPGSHRVRALRDPHSFARGAARATRAHHQTANTRQAPPTALVPRPAPFHLPTGMNQDVAKAERYSPTP